MFKAKYIEIIKYIIVGGLTTLINVVTDLGLRNIGIPYSISIGVAWLACVIFAYFMNKNIVFKNNNASKFTLFFEFMISRLFTLGIEYGLTFIFLTILDYNQTIVKLGVQFVIMALNYLLSKKILSSKNIKT